MTRSLLAVLALSAPAAADEPSTEALFRSTLDNLKQTAEVLKTVTNRASAEKAKPRLEELHASFQKLSRQLDARPKEEARKLFEKNQKEWDERKEAVVLQHDRVFSKHKDAYKALADTGLFRRVEGELEDEALRKAQDVQKACMSYYTRGNGWPRDLTALVEKVNGVGPFLADGKKAILDPWGAPLQFQVSMTPEGYERISIWTHSPYGEKRKLVWPAEKK
jgi:hypothetical protein